jgi:hypothetical protein
VAIFRDRKEFIGAMTFNKDDELILDFIVAASNIRAFNFSIEMESKFKIKEMAGKIIPAISSSNAMVGAMQVIEAIKMLSKSHEKLRSILYRRTDIKRIASFKTMNEIKNPDVIQKL